MRLFISY